MIHIRDNGVCKIQHLILFAGVVLGSLAGVALIGGGTAGYMYKQKQREHSLIMSTSQHNRKGQDFGDISPGGREVSPNGLSNVSDRN